MKSDRDDNESCHEWHSDRTLRGPTFGTGLVVLSKTVKRRLGVNDWPIEWRKMSCKYSCRLDPRVATWWIAGRQSVAS